MRFTVTSCPVCTMLMCANTLLIWPLSFHESETYFMLLWKPIQGNTLHDERMLFELLPCTLASTCNFSEQTLAVSKAVQSHKSLSRLDMAAKHRIACVLCIEKRRFHWAQLHSTRFFHCIKHILLGLFHTVSLSNCWITFSGIDRSGPYKPFRTFHRTIVLGDPGLRFADTRIGYRRFVAVMAFPLKSHLVNWLERQWESCFCFQYRTDRNYSAD